MESVANSTLLAFPLAFRSACSGRLHGTIILSDGEAQVISESAVLLGHCSLFNEIGAGWRLLVSSLFLAETANGSPLRYATVKSKFAELRIYGGGQPPLAAESVAMPAAVRAALRAEPRPFANMVDTPLEAVQSVADVVTLKIAVPNAKVGLLIGRGGRNIAQLQMSTGAQIQIGCGSDTASESERRVTIVASSAAEASVCAYLHTCS